MVLSVLLGSLVLSLIKYDDYIMNDKPRLERPPKYGGAMDGKAPAKLPSNFFKKQTGLGGTERRSVGLGKSFNGPKRK